MPTLVIARAANTSHSYPTVPVAIFIGGTSGIGQAVAQAFASYTKGNAHIIICGRNRAAAESIIASFPKPSSPNAQHEFVECDALIMKNVDTMTSALVARLNKVNYLAISSGFVTFTGRDETAEGIDKKLAINYYSRWKFMHDFLPLLSNAKEAGEDASAMSILAAGGGGEIDLDDFGLKKNYSFVNAASSATTYNDLMIESFAERLPGATFIHSSPGLVRTTVLGSVVKFMLYPFLTAPEDCAEYMLYALLHAEAGAQRRTKRGDGMGKDRYAGTEEGRVRLWEHTVEEIQRAMNVQA